MSEVKGEFKGSYAGELINVPGGSQTVKDWPGN